MKKKLRIVFMGTPGFAVAGLERIHQSEHEVVAVVTAPDRPAGRGRKLKSSEVKEFALSHGIDVLQPEKLRNPEFLAELASYHADLFIVIAFRMLPELVWSIPDLGTINLHASLLPDYRGAAPINWALINGDKRSGLTTFYINEEIDKGHLIESVEVSITPDDNAGTLHDRLMKEGAELLFKTVELIAAGQAIARPQEINNLQVRRAPKLNPENRRINWCDNVESIHNLVRGLSPYPSALSTLKLKNGESIDCKVHKTDLTEEQSLLPGKIKTDNRTYLYVGTGSGVLSIQEIQLSGKRNMAIKDLLNGFEFDDEAVFT